MPRSLTVLLLAFGLVACAQAQPTPRPASAPSAASDTAPDPLLVPIGFGTLRQEELSVRVAFNALSVRFIPLDETVIRALSPDSYRALHGLRESKAAAVEAVRKRNGLAGVDLWYVSFFNLEQGEARFSPMEVVITSLGRDFRPLDILPLSPGFGEQRVKQREVQNALYVFDPAIEVNNLLRVTVEAQQSDAWNDVLKRLERERALIRSRANAAKPATPPPL
ncbi:MAG: hypothetical protein K2X99_06480 [Gemmatimonadaceae bacterium]|nr:hypothetical protein [Gemmatimonadaceae bacterium]